jgi:glycosyltransferase involved in cell wall biosynthesis
VELDTPSATAAPSPPGARRLKVLQVGKFYPPHMGGIETHLEALCGQLAGACDLRVIVASENREASNEVLNGVRLSRVPTQLTFAATPLCPGMIGKIRQSGADIVHLHLPNPGAVLAYLASGHRGRLVITYHSDTVRQKVLGALFDPWLQAALRRAVAIVATSPDYLRTSASLAPHRDRCHVIPYGIALERFEHCDPDARDTLRRQFGERLIISVGRLVYYKGFEFLIRAMTEVRGKLLIIGGGPLEPKLRRMTAELGLQDKVVFAGEIQNENVIPYYHASDIFALASIARSEAFGIVQIEAMAAGIPVVNTRLDSGVPFVSLDGETGLTVPPEDPSALAAALNRLLDDPALRRSLGDRARLRARSEFSIEAMTARMLALYETVAHQQPSAQAAQERACQ